MSDPHSPPRRVAVIGAGVTGLTAAHRLSRAGLEVRVLEASGRVGGKVWTAGFGGRRVELGADAFLARGKEVVELCRELGLGPQLVSPAATQARLWLRGALRPLPPGLGLGLPSRPLALVRGGILTVPGALRAGLDLVLPATPVGPRTSVAELVERRFGRQVVENLVDPLLGGVYAGDVRRLGLREAMPELYAAARRGSVLRAGARRRPTPTGPTFYSLRDGLGELPNALLAALPAGSVSLGFPARSIERAGSGLAVTGAAGHECYDAVVLAVPAPAASDLLAGALPAASERLRGIAYASVASVLLAFPRSALPAGLGSGFLVPRREGRLVSGCTLVSEKWPLGGDGPAVVRCSVGRFGDERWRALAEADLVDRVTGELKQALGISTAPEATCVTPWPQALPQYQPGHADAVAEIEREAAALPGLVLAGAAYRGIGIAACVADGEAAARRLLEAPGRGSSPQ
jgi:protoporphyrinogen/coproporphyrinogen III oxidase